MAGYRVSSFGNLLRMGHCAPTVMQTLVSAAAPDEPWLVNLSAGMPGGIGNTGFECGALTSPLVLFGLNLGLRDSAGGLPVIFDKGHALRRRFLECHKTMICKEIRGNDRFPFHCIRPVLLAPELYMENRAYDGQDAIPGAVRETYARLYAHLVEQGFHCARSVFEQLEIKGGVSPQLPDALSAFIGGTMFMGLTCGAFTAGVMAIGLERGEIEDSVPRVVRLLYRMTTGGDAFDEKINKFNASMNAGYRLSKWFKREFGSTQCRVITQSDFCSHSGVTHYVENGGVSQCREIAAKVADKVEQMLADASAPSRVTT